MTKTAAHRELRNGGLAIVGIGLILLVILGFLAYTKDQKVNYGFYIAPAVLVVILILIGMGEVRHANDHFESLNKGEEYAY